MTLDDLLARLRDTAHLDDAVEEYQFSDEDCIAALNDAVRQAAIRKRLVLDRTTAEVCSYAVDVNGSSVTLHKRVLAIRSARWSESDCPLTLTTLKVMDKDQPDWPSSDAGTPTHVIVDAQSGGLVLWPSTDTAGTLSLAVWRAPLDTEMLEGGQDEPIIDEVFHEDLLDWAMAVLYRGRDGERSDLQRAADAEARFTEKFGRLPSAHEIKCWAIAPVRGQRAEFV